MTVRLKKLADQVIVITGATSGIGLTTARAAASQGARLVLAARDQHALDHLASELKMQGVPVTAVAVDVGNPADMTKLGQAAIAAFGRIDTWVNNAGVSIFGRLEEVSLQDGQRLFQTNFWGVVHGSLEAVRRMKQRSGGALINVGSEVSDRAVPLQGMYSASKHAVKGFTDALRVELEEEGAPISVTLIKPAAIDTMFAVHAKNYLETEPVLPPPLHAPELVANAILYAAQHPRRDVYVGGAARLASIGGFHMPRLLDVRMRRKLVAQQHGAQPASASRPNALHSTDPAHELRERQGAEGHVIEYSPYTTLSLHARAVRLSLIGGGALWAAWKLSRPVQR
jgi:short-subunit dehydrogenase